MTGLAQTEAEDAIADAGLLAAVETAYSDDVAEGFVISQEPAAGTEVDAGSTVTIVVSRGIEPEPEDECGCLGCNGGDDKGVGEKSRRLLGDWLLAGLGFIVLLGLANTHKH